MARCLERVDHSQGRPRRSKRVTHDCFNNSSNRVHTSYKDVYPAKVFLIPRLRKDGRTPAAQHVGVQSGVPST